MPKKTRDEQPGDGGEVPASKAERMPPPLSDELIAKLHGAVDAARRRRLQQPGPAKAPRIEFAVERDAADPAPGAPSVESPRYRGKDRRASKRS